MLNLDLSIWCRPDYIVFFKPFVLDGEPQDLLLVVFYCWIYATREQIRIPASSGQAFNSGCIVLFHPFPERLGCYSVGFTERFQLQIRVFPELPDKKFLLERVQSLPAHFFFSFFQRSALSSFLSLL